MSNCTAGSFKGYHERRADDAYEAYAAPFVARTKAAYRGCRTAADLHALSRKCWKEADEAARTSNRNGYENFTRHGTMPYDRLSALHDQAKTFAIEFYKKAKRIEAGESIAVVCPAIASATEAAQ